jgi:hypothetical protein
MFNEKDANGNWAPGFWWGVAIAVLAMLCGGNTQGGSPW